MIWWIAQSLITKFCFSDIQHISIVVKTFNLQWAWRKLMNHSRQNPQQQSVSPLCNSLNSTVQGKAISVGISKSYSSMVVYSSSKKDNGCYCKSQILLMVFLKMINYSDVIVNIDSVDSDLMGVFVNGILKRCYSNFPFLVSWISVTSVVLRGRCPESLLPVE